MNANPTLPPWVAEKLIIPLAVAAILGLFAMYTKVIRLEVVVDRLLQDQVYYHGHKQ